MRGNARPAGWLAACLSLALITACGDDDSQSNNNTVQPDAEVDAAPDAEVGEHVTFLVHATPTVGATSVPAEGVTVAFDRPGGERVEATTDAGGRVTFGSIDWTLGEAAVTAHLFGYTMTSIVHLDAARIAALVNGDGEVPVLLVSQTPVVEDLVNISGTATGLEDDSHTYTVATVDTLVHGGIWAGAGTLAYNIDVPRGTPFVIQAVEATYSALPSGQGYDQPIYQWMQMDYGPITTDETDVELDFPAHTMPLSTADVSMLMPPRPDSPIRSGQIPYCYVCSEESIYCHGWPTYLDVVDNQNRVDISYVFTEPAWVLNPRWFCYVRATTGELAQTMVPGTPVQDDQATLMDTPTWVTPSDAQADYPLHDPLEWTWYEDVTHSGVSILRSGRQVWVIMAGPNATTATVPAAPSTVDESQVLGSSAYLQVFGGTRENDRVWQRFANGLAVGATL